MVLDTVKLLVRAVAQVDRYSARILGSLKHQHTQHSLVSFLSGAARQLPTGTIPETNLNEALWLHGDLKDIYSAF